MQPSGLLRPLLAVVVCVVFSLPAGSAFACKPVAFSIWYSTIFKWRQTCTHPLCGRVGDAHDGEPPPAEAIFDVNCTHLHSERFYAVHGTVWETLRDGGIVIIGEVHDNPEDHRFRGVLTEFIGGQLDVPVEGRRRAEPAAVFEHIRGEQKPALEKFVAKPGSADDLFAALDWDKSGWPDKKLFAPLYEAVIAARLPIYAGDPAREMIKKVAKEGEAALPEEERKRLGLDKPLPAVSQEGLLDDLEKSHCGLMPKTAFGKLAYAQRYRDAWLADTVLTAAKEHGSAILFAGNGHVRADRGVPWYIRQRAPEKKVVTVMLVEVEDGKTKPEDYDLKGDDGKPVADFVVFTPRAERPDPCEDMKKMFEKKKGG